MENIKEFILEGNTFDKHVAPFKEILDGSDVNNYSLILSEENKIILNDVFRLKVNVKSVGELYFLLPLESFDRETAVNKISPLKGIKIFDEETAKAKVEKLIETVNEFKPLLVFYIPNGKFLLSLDKFANFSWNFPAYYQEQKEEFTEEKPLPIKKEKVKDNSEKVSFKEKAKNFFSQVKWFFAPFKKDGFYYLFAFIATLLIGFTSSIGIFNCYDGKLICIFFFVCSLVGAVLNYFVYSDLFKKVTLKDRSFYFALFFSVLGAGLSALTFLLFYSLQKQIPESLNNTTLIYILTVVISLASSLLGILIALLVRKFKK